MLKAINEKRTLPDESPMIDVRGRRSFEAGACFGYKLAMAELAKVADIG